MDINDFTDIIQNVCNDNTKGVLILQITKDELMNFYKFGELSFLEKLGLLEAYKHDILQEPDQEFLEERNPGFRAVI
jgi:hypothetical protein